MFVHVCMYVKYIEVVNDESGLVAICSAPCSCGGGVYAFLYSNNELCNVHKSLCYVCT